MLYNTRTSAMPAKKYHVQTARIIRASKLFLPVTIQKRVVTDSHKCPREDAGKRL